jgi:excisionase family DNA binding protein
MDSDDNILDYRGAAACTGLPVGTLYALVSHRRIPHLRLGPRLVRFSSLQLREWLATHSIPDSRSPG